MPESKDNPFVVGKTEKTMSRLTEDEIYGEPSTGYTKDNVFTEKLNTNSTIEYPRSKAPSFLGNGKKPIEVDPQNGVNDHILKPIDVSPNRRHPLRTREHFVRDVNAHFTRDVAQNIEGETTAFSLNPNEEAPITAPTKPGTETRVFSGATTQMNPTNDKDKAEMLDNGGLDRYAERHKLFGSYNKPPISPFQPFTRMNSDTNRIAADQAVFNTYNRTKLPIADIEWRKGFRHIFITRPECYLTYRSNGKVDLCDQAGYDTDFQSAWMRMPHIIRLLSPWYVSGSFPQVNTPHGMNWNYLLSNRVTGLSAGGTTMSVNDNVGKSIEGFTVIPAMHVETRQGSSIELSFTDTKNLEVYETARLWMLYMYKRKKGIFIPPYNGYQKTNAFLTKMESDGKFAAKRMSGFDYTRNHPYDRALEYCASLYDIVTNETGTKILYWCKYYGIYPISVTPSLNNDNNGPITEMKTTISFKYHYKLENSNQSLVEFNHDAGIVDDIGRMSVNINKMVEMKNSDGSKYNDIVGSESYGINDATDLVTLSQPFLLRYDGMDNDAMNHYMPRYIGAAGMFTGSPYIVIRRSQMDPLDPETVISTPQLMFMVTGSPDYDGQFNVGIVNDKIDIPVAKNIVGYRGALFGETTEKAVTKLENTETV